MAATAEQYYIPWVGANYDQHRLLVVSESAYTWKDGDEWIDPLPSHPTRSVLYNIENFGLTTYFKAVNRALSGKESPTRDELQKVWNECAYTIFVQKTVGLKEDRPSEEQWVEASTLIPDLLERLRPAKMIVTGRTVWNRMPNTFFQISADVQAYKLQDDNLVWCLALPHPRNSTEGFKALIVGEYIKGFRRLALPKRVQDL